MPYFSISAPLPNTNTPDNPQYTVFALRYKPESGRGSSVGIATRYGDRTPVGARFSALVQTGPAPPSPLYSGYRVFPGGKSGRGATLTTHPPPSADVMKEKSYTPTPPLGPCGLLQGETLPLPYKAEGSEFDSRWDQ